ncbi:MAG: hypothetical protein R6X35_03480 [Candidatus Krumholzibacteriia bacterium]
MAEYGTMGSAGKDPLPGPVSEGRGRTEVRLVLLPQGRDLLLLITGGEAHVGAVAVAQPAADGGPAGEVVIPPHKEGPLAAECAALVAEAAGCTCAAAAGIHQDDATAQEIATITANVRRAARRLAAALGERRSGP